MTAAMFQKRSFLKRGEHLLMGHPHEFVVVTDHRPERTARPRRLINMEDTNA